MNKLDENRALAIVFANTKRKKRKENLYTIAKAFDYLVKSYGSQKAVANKVGLSTEMIRQFLSVLKLPYEVQMLFSNRQIDSVDVAKELHALKEPTKQIIAAKAILDNLSKDVRDIKRLVKETNTKIEEAKKIVLDAKPNGLHIFVIDFDNEAYQAIIKYSRTLKVKPAELLREIIIDWLRQKANINKKEKVD